MTTGPQHPGRHAVTVLGQAPLRIPSTERTAGRTRDTVMLATITMATHIRTCSVTSCYSGWAPCTGGTLNMSMTVCIKHGGRTSLLGAPSVPVLGRIFNCRTRQSGLHLLNQDQEARAQDLVVAVRLGATEEAGDDSASSTFQICKCPSWLAVVTAPPDASHAPELYYRQLLSQVLLTVCVNHATCSDNKGRE